MGILRRANNQAGKQNKNKSGQKKGTQTGKTSLAH